MKKRFNKKKVIIKLYLAGNEFAATAKDDLFFVDKCYASTPERANKLALEKIKQYYLEEINLQNKFMCDGKFSKEIAR